LANTKSSAIVNNNQESSILLITPVPNKPSLEKFALLAIFGAIV